MRILLAGAAALALAACSQSEEAEVPADDTAATTDSGTTVADAGAPTVDGVKPVMIGGDGPDMDACGTLSKVVAGGDPVVRSADNATANEVATLEAGQNVIVCDSGAEGWSGIVFDPVDKQNPTCGTGSPVAEEQEYKGICTSGWIQSENLEMIAG